MHGIEADSDEVELPPRVSQADSRQGSCLQDRSAEEVLTGNEVDGGNHTSRAPPCRPLDAPDEGGRGVGRCSPRRSHEFASHDEHTRPLAPGQARVTDPAYRFMRSSISFGVRGAPSEMHSLPSSVTMNVSSIRTPSSFSRM